VVAAEGYIFSINTANFWRIPTLDSKLKISKKSYFAPKMVLAPNFAFSDEHFPTNRRKFFHKCPTASPKFRGGNSFTPASHPLCYDATDGGYAVRCESAICRCRLSYCHIKQTEVLPRSSELEASDWKLCWFARNYWSWATVLQLVWFLLYSTE